MSEPRPSDYYATFGDHLRELGVEPVLIGALAAEKYRDVERFTTDVDFMLKDFRDVADRLEAEGYSIRSIAQPGGAPYLIFVRGHGVKVDLLLAETPYHQQALDRADADGILAVEDVIVFKLIAWREKDRSDIRSILRVGHHLDEQYIERWAAEWDVADRWAAARTGTE